MLLAIDLVAIDLICATLLGLTWVVGLDGNGFAWFAGLDGFVGPNVGCVRQVTQKQLLFHKRSAPLTHELAAKPHASTSNTPHAEGPPVHDASWSTGLGQ